MSLKTDIQKLSGNTLITLFVLDATPNGGDVLRFHAGVNELGNDIVWQGNTYTRFPVEANGFELQAKGVIPRPKIRISNTTSLISALILDFNDLINCKVTRKRTFLRYLDAENFAAGNPEADPDQYFADDIYTIDRKSAENSKLVEFELAAAFDVQGVMLPRRQIVQNVCAWRYRGAECGYTGTDYFKHDDTATGDSSLDKCGKRLSSCKLRFGQYSELPYGGFPAAGLVR